jgi:DNA gyrase subunit A
VAKTFGTPRRTVLLEASGQTTTSTATPLEVADDPCYVFLSSSGLLARTTTLDPPGDGGGRTRHDVIVSAVTATARGEVGVLTSDGRVVKLGVLDLPTLPSTANHPNLQGGAPVGEFLTLEGERVLGLTSFDPASPGLAIGTRQGVVKRVNPEYLSARDDWDVISLKDGDEVVGVAAVTDTDELVLVASDASLLHFPASAVRPQGRAAGGMAGIKLAAGQRVVAFGAVRAEQAADAVVVTVAGASGALPGTQAGSAKVTPFEVYPGKGRATGGVRAHRFLRNEDALILAWVGAAPAWATGSAGQPVELPPLDPRRDMSGTALAAPVHAIG